jgi:hypothetical protein
MGGIGLESGGRGSNWAIKTTYLKFVKNMLSILNFKSFKRNTKIGWFSKNVVTQTHSKQKSKIYI